jgi:TPR repeat protein
VSALRFTEGPLRDVDRGLASSRRGCELGSALGCSNYAAGLREFRGPFDPARREVARFLRLGCTPANQHGCVLLARAHLAGEDGIERDPPRAFELFRAACDGAPPNGCFEYGQLALTPAPGRGADLAVAIRALDAACMAEEPQACRMLGGIVFDANHPEAHERGARIFGRGCDLGDAESCMAVLLLTLRGEGVAQDVERAVPALDRLCQGGAAPACEALALHFYRSVRPDGRAVVRFGDRGCELGSARSCAVAAQERLRFAAAGGRDDAMAYARSVCAGAQRAHCSDVVNAILYEGVSSSNALATRDALPLLDDACRAGGLASCLSSSVLRTTGLFGIAQDDARAAAELIRVCREDGPTVGLACGLAATMTRAGLGTERDLVRAAARAERACGAGSNSSCGLLGFMTARGEGVSANLAESARLAQRECEGNRFCARSLDDPRALAASCRAAPSVPVGGSIEGETAGDDLARASCGSLARSPERVFRVELRRRQSLRIEAQRLTVGFDPVVYVRRSCADERSELACNDDPLAGLNERSRIERPFDPGTYWVFVDGFGATNAGRFRLSISSVDGDSGGAGSSGAGPSAKD